MSVSTTPVVLFDMDGTLVDSTAVVEHTWTEFAHLHGLDAAEVITFAHGRPTAATVVHFLDDVTAIDAETARIVAYEETVVDGIIEIPGAAAMVATLEPGRWAVVTSAGRTLARHRMAAAGIDIPDILVSSDDITSGKPDPQGYLLAAKALGVDIADCIVFEDSDAGVRAGIASGAQTIVVGALATFDDTLHRITDFVDVEVATLITTAT